ncbi:MAG: hypothetical protein ABS939_04560 [Psychrobacillus sp.]
MTRYLVTCVIEGDNNISKEVLADSPKVAIDKVAVQHSGTDVVVLEDGYKTEFVKSSKIIKFIVIDLDEQAKVNAENARIMIDSFKF